MRKTCLKAAAALALIAVPSMAFAVPTTATVEFDAEYNLSIGDGGSISFSAPIGPAPSTITEIGDAMTQTLVILIVEEGGTTNPCIDNVACDVELIVDITATANDGVAERETEGFGAQFDLLVSSPTTFDISASVFSLSLGGMDGDGLNPSFSTGFSDPLFSLMGPGTDEEFILRQGTGRNFMLDTGEYVFTINKPFGNASASQGVRIPQVPEPGTLALFGMSLAAAGTLRRFSAPKGHAGYRPENR